MSSSGQLWRVVGGSQQGGIIVREGRALNSAKRPERLATGTVVEEQELVEERLSYRRLAGDGPDSGWVSLKLKDRDLLVRVPTFEVPEKLEQDSTSSSGQAVLALSAENTGQRELLAHPPESRETDAVGSVEATRPEQAERETASQISGDSLEAPESDHVAEEAQVTKTAMVADMSESLPAVMERIADAEEPDSGELSRSPALSDLDRVDRINRGNFWFDFDGMSNDDDGDEDKVSQPVTSEEPPEPAAASPLSEEANSEKAEEIVGAMEAHMQEARDLASIVQPLLDEPVLCSDSDGAPRGRCLCCEKCDACSLDYRPYICWAGSPLDWGQHEEKPSYRTGDKVEVRDKLGEDWTPGIVVTSQPSVFVRPDHWNAHQRNFTFIRRARAADAPALAERCQRCGCASSAHEKLWEWKMHTELSLGRFRNTGKNTKKKLPERSRVPLAALKWSYDDVAIFVLTAGVFDPRRDGRDGSLELHRELKPEPSAGEREADPGSGEQKLEPLDPEPKMDQSSAKPEPNSSHANLLVSVVTPTSDKRHVFHPLLYRAFCNQTYEPKELVVVDTGESPSTFLEERAREDKRLVYRWFNVKDSRQQNLAECLIEPPKDNYNTGGIGKGFGGKSKGKGIPIQNTPLGRSRFHLNGKVRGGTPVEGWTLGMKRNLACHLARGSIIAHFDDDDLYAQRYLEVMVSKLCSAIGYHGHAWQSKELPAGAATLQDWHVFDLVDATFGFVSPLTDPLVEEHMREPYAYGFGFSYLYTRAAWELVMFADVEWSEDGHFVQELMASGKAVKLIKSQGVQGCDALAAHSYHSDTTSGGEFVDFQVNAGFARKAVTRSVRMGQKVQPPVSLQGLLPTAFQVVKQAGFKKGAIHPLRQQLSELPVGPEVSLDEKQFFMRTDVGREISFAASGARRIPVASNLNQHRWRPPQPGVKGAGRGFAWGERPGVCKPPGFGRGGTAFAGGQGGMSPWRRS